MVVNQGELVQAFELQAGRCNIDNSFIMPIHVKTVVHAVEDSVLKVHFPSGDELIEMKAGMDFAINDTKVTVESGKIHYN